MKNGEIVRMNYSSSLDRLISGDRIGVRRTAEGVLRFFVNGEDLGIAETDLPSKVEKSILCLHMVIKICFFKQVYAVIELFGSTVSVTAISSSSNTEPQKVTQLQVKINIQIVH